MNRRLTDVIGPVRGIGVGIATMLMSILLGSAVFTDHVSLSKAIPPSIPSSAPSHSAAASPLSDKTAHIAAAATQPAVTQSARTSISGTVKYQRSGNPVVHARVSAVEHRGTKEIHTYTGAAGAFKLEGLEPRTEHAITVQSPKKGFIAIQGVGWTSLAEGEKRTNVSILLASGGDVSGKVVDKSVSYDLSRLPALVRSRDKALYDAFMREANRPLSGIRIALVDVTRSQSEAPILETVTDHNGAYRLRDCPAGKYVILAERPGSAVMMNEKNRSRYREVDIPPLKDVCDVDFSFRLDAVSVTGRVVDVQGKPISGARLAAAQPDRDRGDGEIVAAETGKVEGVSGENGEYKLIGLAPAHILHAVGFLWHDGEFIGDEFTYKVRTRASGYVTSEVAVPSIPEALVKPAKSFIKEVLRIGADEFAGQRLPKFTADLLRYGRDGAICADITLAREASVSGRLVDSRENIVKNAAVRIRYVETPKDKAKLLGLQPVVPDEVITSESGGFQITCIPNGRYVFQAEIKGVGMLQARNAPISLREGDALTDLELVVESADDRGDITGSVRDAASRSPIRQYTLSVSKVDSPAEPHPRQGDVAVEESRNSFSVCGVSPGVATLLVAAPGYPPMEFPVLVESGKIAPVSVELAREGTIEGAVTLNGAPASGRVRVRLDDDRPIYEPWGQNQHSAVNVRSVNTGADGSFSIGGLSIGIYLVRADVVTSSHAPLTYRHHWITANVESGRATRVHVDSEGESAISGSFSFPIDYKYGWIHVYEGEREGLSLITDESKAWRLIRASSDSNGESGPFEFSGLPPGAYTVTAFCFGRKGKTGEEYEQDRRQVSRVVTIGDGEKIELDLELETPP